VAALQGGHYIIHKRTLCTSIYIHSTSMFYVFLLFKYIRAVMVVTSESAGASCGGSSGRATTLSNSLSPLSLSLYLSPHSISLSLSTGASCGGSSGRETPRRATSREPRGCSWASLTRTRYSTMRRYRQFLPPPPALSLSVGDAVLYYEQVMCTHVHTLASS
jgi:hypothetical protein